VPLSVVEGDLLDRPVDAMVNACNRNVILCWLLVPQGVSGAIKQKDGTTPSATGYDVRGQDNCCGIGDS
jgi:O-acetyl-ADP-ribose deacetylase (regulator of RNase III)